MAWQDRIQKAAYVSPKPTRIEFSYENVSKSFEKKTGAFEFPNVDGTLVQDLGRTGRRYPLRVFIHGDNYDTQANAFEEALQERGLGTLEHPLYGNIRVVPFGPVTRRDDLVTGAGQAVFEVEFWETIETNYPTRKEDAKGESKLKVDAANEASANDFNSKLDLSAPGSATSFKQKFTASINAINSTLKPIADKATSTQRAFSATAQSILTSVDSLATNPKTLALQTIKLSQIPSNVKKNISSQVVAFQNLSSQLFNAVDNINDFSLNDLLTTSFMNASILSALSADLQTRTYAIEIADSIATQFDSWTAWREEHLDTLSDIDSGAGYQATLDAYSSVQRYLISASFSLDQEKALILSSARSVLDLCFEFYGKVDNETLDFFINTNAFTGSEIYDEIPAGRRVIYYS